MTTHNTVDQCFTEFNYYSSVPIIDLRGTDKFSNWHWSGSSNFPVAEIISRQSELPRTNQPLRLIGETEQLKIAERRLTEKGYKIACVILSSDKLKALLESKDLVSVGSYSPCLWSPAKLVKAFQNNIFPKNIDDTLTLGNALDIACGAGRDAVYLAQKGWQVTAIDYSSSALNKLQQLAKNNQVSVNGIQMDIEKDLTHFTALTEQYQLVLVSRYLHRPLLPILNQKLAINGYLLYQTFMRGCEAFGSPRNPRFLLEKGELADIFSDFEILLDEIYYLDDGRPMNRFIAKKHF